MIKERRAMYDLLSRFTMSTYWHTVFYFGRVRMHFVEDFYDQRVTDLGHC